MMKRTLLLAFAAFTLFLVGCQHVTNPVTLKEASVPDRPYDVTVYWSAPLYYAVLFDIPDDGKEVAMFYSYAVERVGLDTPKKYVDQFQSTVMWYQTLEISDLDGNVRGYLMISKKLGYFFYERPVGERIIVDIYDPHLGGDAARRVP